MIGAKAPDMQPLSLSGSDSVKSLILAREWRRRRRGGTLSYDSARVRGPLRFVELAVAMIQKEASSTRSLLGDSSAKTSRKPWHSPDRIQAPWFLRSVIFKGNNKRLGEIARKSQWLRRGD